MLLRNGGVCAVVAPTRQHAVAARAAAAPTRRHTCGGLTAAQLPARSRHPARAAGLMARFRNDKGHSSSPTPDEDDESADTPPEQQQATERRGQPPVDAAALSGEAADTPEQQQDMEHCRHCRPLPVDATALSGEVPVVFELGKHCPFGHTFAIVGDAPELGSWDISKAVRLEWSEGDVWRASVLLPLELPVSFKYVQLQADGGALVEWGADVAGGDNMTVTVTRSDALISGFTVELLPKMPCETDIATDAAEPSASMKPYLTARLDIDAVLPVSASYFSETRLAVAAGLPATLAEDMVTDRALLEQGLLSEADLQAKWSPQQLAALAEKQGWGDIAGSEVGGGPVDLTAGVGLASGYADAGAVAAAVDEGLVDEPRLDEAPQLTGSSSRGRTLTSLDDELTPEASPVDTPAAPTAAQSLDEAAVEPAAEPAADTSFAAVVTDAASHIVSSTHNNDSASSVDSSDSANAAAAAAVDVSDTPQQASCGPLPPADTKIVSANVSASTIDESAPLLNASRPVVEVEGTGWDLIDPIRVNQPLSFGASGPAGSEAPDAEQAVDKQHPVVHPAAADLDTSDPVAGPSDRPSVRITTDGGMAVNMRGADPLSLPDKPEVAAVRGAEAGSSSGFGEEAGLDEGLLLSPELMGDAAAALPDAAADLGHDDGDDDDAGGRASSSTSSRRAGSEVVTPAGRDEEERGWGSHEGLLADASQAQAAGLPAQAEGMTNPDRPGALSRDEEQLAAMLAAAAAAAATVRYAGGASAAEMLETAAAVDERNALLQGPDTPTVAQVMAEAAVIAPQASPAEVAGVQEVADVLRQAARERQASQQQDDSGEQSHGSAPSSRWWRRWLRLGEDDSNKA